jgi:phosphoglycerate dehydrogenase-like enzyme
MTRMSLTRCATAAGFITALFMAGAASAGGAQSAAPQLDVATVVKEYQLVESSKAARDLVPGWTTPRKLLVLVDKPERTAWLQQAMPKGVQVIGVRSDAEAAPYLAEADALVMLPCRPALLAKAPKVKWLHMGSGGSDQCLAIKGIAEGRVLMTNGQKVKNTVLAEMAMGYVFALARSIDVGLQNQQLKDLNAIHGRPAKQLEGSTMLVVGLGGAGTEIARIAHSLGMKVLATRNSSHEGPDFVSYVGLADETPKLVSQADVVVICAPLTPATRGLFNAEMFSRMKKDAMLINWTRAEITVPDDLAAALKAGTIGSAALNWATAEPLPKDHPLWSAPNLILAPWAGTGGGAEANKANQSDTTVEMRWVVIRENMRRFATGDKMYSVFDIERGY